MRFSGLHIFIASSWNTGAPAHVLGGIGVVVVVFAVVMGRKCRVKSGTPVRELGTAGPASRGFLGYHRQMLGTMVDRVLPASACVAYS
jgi:hypothetical protein